MIEKEFGEINITVYPALGDTLICKVVSLDNYSGRCDDTLYASPADSFTAHDAVVIGRFVLYEKKIEGDYSWNRKTVIKRFTLRVVGKSITDILATATAFKINHPQYRREFLEVGSESKS